MELLENNFCCSVLFFSKSTSIKYYARMEWNSAGTIGQKIICCCCRFLFFVDFSAQNQPQQEWNGIVRELLDRKADIAVAPMTINFARFVTLKYNV